MTSTRLVDRITVRILLGVLALVLTVTLAVYQRRTGPSWPIPVQTTVGQASVQGELPRSHSGDGEAPIRLQSSSPELTGEMLWRRYPTDEDWQRVSLRREDDELVAELPHQPPAGKVEYSIRLSSGGEEVRLNDPDTVVLRFTGAVPGTVLLPHILCMFIALALSLRAALGALFGERGQGTRLLWLLAFLVVGGLILGPIVQKFAFGAYWTGWPFGDDWTDNKTLGAVLAWILAVVVARKWGRGERVAVLLAAAVMVGVYLIPHSIHGSELDWEEVDGASAPQEASLAQLATSLKRTPSLSGVASAGH